MSNHQTKEYQSTPINVRLSTKTIELVDLAVLIGYAKNRVDFAENAMIRKLEQLGLFKQKITSILDALNNKQLIEDSS